MGQRHQELVPQWTGKLIPEYVPKWYGKPRSVRNWITVMTWVIGVFTVAGMLLGLTASTPLVTFGSLGIGGLALAILQGIWGEKQRGVEREYDLAHEFVSGWMKQLGMGLEYEERRCLHILACLAHLLHHSVEVEDATSRRQDFWLAEQLMFFLYGEPFERDFRDRFEVKELRRLVSIAELQRPDSLISEHYRSRSGYRGKMHGIAHI